jgi:hypothetical protein
MSCVVEEEELCRQRRSGEITRGQARDDQLMDSGDGVGGGIGAWSWIVGRHG